MKKIKYALLACFSALAITSCIVDDENREDFLAETQSIYGFKDAKSVNVFLPANVAVVKGEAFVQRQSSDNGSLDAQSFSYTLSQTNPALTILNESNILNINANGTVSNPLKYEINPTLLNIGDDITITVTITPLNNGIVSINNTFDIVLQKCNPVLAGTYTVSSGNFGGNGEQVILTAKDCAGNYTASNLAPFNSQYTWSLKHDTTTNQIVVDGTLGTFPNTVKGSGVYNSNGTITFTGINVSGTGLQNYNFVLTP